MFRQIATTLFVFLLVIGQSYAQETLLVEIDKLSPRTLRVEGFTLERAQEIKIQATGFNTHRRHAFTANAWILDAKTREVIWEMKEANTKRRDRTLRDFEGAVSLPAGTYEVYYSSFSYYGDGFHVNDLGNAMTYLYDQLFERDDRRGSEGDWQDGDGEEYRREYEELGITIRGAGRKLDEKALQSFIEATKSDAAINMSPLRDEEHKRQGFILDRPTELELYALGEATYDNDFDYGWIIDTKTREKVWKFTYDNSKPAGGAEKNRMFQGTLKLPAGNYAAIFVTDDSHSYRRWNSPPPYDPEYWGLAVRVRNPAERTNLRLYEYEDLPKKNIFLELTRVRDDEYLSKGFTLKQPLDVRIYAMGEGRDNEMFDYGWIVETKSRKKVWTMDLRDTEHAGGDNKNRLFDEVVRLEKGSYLVHYVTDGSHSYRDWNASAPFEQERWGVTLMAANDNFDASLVADYQPEEDKSVLAQIINVRDDQERQISFSLDKSGEARVYALGEGSEGNMQDYGWIEEAATGKVVWEMTYRMTEHAGGAHKNRAFDERVYLKAGEYELHYRTDGSHSARDWNADPPHDPMHWGITVYRPE